MKNVIKTILIVLTFASCGTKEKEAITPNSNEILGDLFTYLEVVTGEYKLSGDSYEKTLQIQIECSEVFPEDLNDKKIYLTFIGLNKDNSTVGINNFQSLPSDSDKIIALLQKGEGKDYVTFSTYSSEKELFESISTFKVSSLIKEKKKSSSSIASNQSIDKMLDAYEDYMDSYMELYKKSQEGDMSALTEYGEVMEKGQELEKKLNKVKGDLTPKQLKRFLKIQEELLKSISK